jgi:hypothetical protein
MTELILKKDIDDSKMQALLAFLKSWGVEVEVKKTSTTSVKKVDEFSLSTGLWSDYAIDSSELRKKAWLRNDTN